MTCKPFDVVEVPFPFTDIARAKRRKALVLSTAEFNRRNRNSILMMITSAQRSEWYLDIKIEKWREAGLKKPCFARMKVFTLDNRLIISKTGVLHEDDESKVKGALKKVMPFYARR